MSKPDFAVCIRNIGYEASLELRKIYQVLPDDQAIKLGRIRVIDESGEDYLFPEDFFFRLKVPTSLALLLSEAA
ncbi:MAG TPA: hypothetical protein VMH83_15850 [Candidatus Acidoferrum sp.]|nr:hypothetical protein [Candidatus Acidoferrum sp.]